MPTVVPTGVAETATPTTGATTPTVATAVTVATTAGFTATIAGCGRCNMKANQIMLLGNRHSRRYFGHRKEAESGRLKHD